MNADHRAAAPSPRFALPTSGNRAESFTITTTQELEEYCASSRRSAGELAIRVAVAVGIVAFLALAAAAIWSVRGAL